MIQRVAEALIVLALVTPAAIARADVKAEEKSQVRFEGGLGRMMGMFGGKAMQEGMVSTSAVKGDRKLTMSEMSGQIIDLKEEKVYDLDVRNRSYTVTTFAEMRKRVEEAQKKAAEQTPGEKPAEKPRDAKELEIDFDLKETGQKRTVNGFDAREIVMMVVAREKGKTLEQSGGMVLTSNSWLTPDVPALKELQDFDRRYAETLYGPAMMDAQQMAMAVSMYPMLKDAMARLQKERVNLQGTPVLTTMKVEAVGNAEQAAASEKGESNAPANAGGLGGMLARRMMRRDKDKQAAAAEPSTPGRATVFTMTHEVLKVTPAASDADVAIPAGFKPK